MRFSLGCFEIQGIVHGLVVPLSLGSKISSLSLKFLALEFAFSLDSPGGLYAQNNKACETLKIT